MYWGRGSSTWLCDDMPEKHVIKVNLYDVTRLPEKYRYKVLTEMDSLDRESLQGIPISAFGNIVSTYSTHMVINSANGQKIFAGYRTAVKIPPSDAPRGIKDDRALPWESYTAQPMTINPKTGQPEPMTIYRVNTAGGYHRCRRGEGAVTLPMNALFMLYGDPSINGITRSIPARDICQFVSNSRFPVPSYAFSAP